MSHRVNATLKEHFTPAPEAVADVFGLPVVWPALTLASIGQLSPMSSSASANGTSFLNHLGYNCAMAKSSVISDADVLEHVFSPVEGGLDPDAARAILELKFDKDATKRIRQLLQKNNRGTISAEERITLEKFLRVGKFIDLMHAKARLSLKEAGLPR